jgi:pilus assembly protein CpaE
MMKTKHPHTVNVSILYATGSPNPAFPEVFSSLTDLKLLKEAKDPETFLTQHQELFPDLALVDLDGANAIPEWLEYVIAQLPQTEVVVCAQSRDPDFLIQIMKLRIGGFLPLPLNREELEATLEQVRAAKAKHHEPSSSQILVVTGTKGGVGTTSFATNLAVALAEIVHEGVILVDLARPFPHVGQFLDLKSKHTIKDLMESANNLDPMFVKKIVLKHKSDLDVLLNQPDYNLAASMVPDFRALSKIFTTLRTSYSWVVVDLGSWLDLFYIRVLQEADQILLVTELTIPNLQNAKIIKSLFQEWGLDDQKLKVLVNHYAKHYALGLNNLESIFVKPALYTFPHQYYPIVEAINQGEPLWESAPRSKLWQRLKELAAELVAQNQPKTEKPIAAKPGLLRKIFS